MCRVDERIYISADGRESKFEESFPCEKAKNGRLCSKVKKRTTEYYPKKAINPPTPTNTGPYNVQQVRPSSSSSRPSTRDGQKLIIEFGSSKDKSGKKYPAISLSTNAQNSSSFSSGPTVPNGVAVDSSDKYHAAPTSSTGYHHRNKSSTSSYTGSSGTPYTDPDYDSPATTRSTGTLVHNPTSGSPSSRPRGQRRLSSAYSTAVMAPSGFSSDYNDFADRSASSHASSGVSSSTRRAKESDKSRKRSDEYRKPEEFDREVAAALASEENKKQVRFEIGRAQSRAKERGENKLAEMEKQRAEDREEERRRKAKDRQRREDRTQIPQSRKPERPMPTTEFVPKRAGSRRPSMTQAEFEEQQRLLQVDLAYMQGESQIADAREREEIMALQRQQQQQEITTTYRQQQPGTSATYRQQQPENNSSLREQQQETSYYNPRDGMPQMDSSIGRRDSISRRDSLSASASAPPTSLGRSSSTRRRSIVQPVPPTINTQVSSTHGHLPSTRKHEPPPAAFHNFSTRTRAPSISSSQENPFTPTSTVLPPSPAIHQDPWSHRTMRDALPSPYPPASTARSDGRYTIQRRGEEVINGASTHHTARQATLAMGRAAEYGNDYAIDDSSDELTHGHTRKW